MKRLVKLTKVTKEQVEVEVEFPIYREQDVSGDTFSAVIFTKVEPDREISIHKTERYAGEDEIEWQVVIDNMPHLASENMEYALGKGKYKSNEERFNSALAELRKFVGGL